jgi:3-deoxy-D-manno-octulosonate 8-phosphate phosphatase KdsC-like HAD superfamily phosphatase
MKNDIKLIIFDITGVLTTDGHLISSLLKSILPQKDKDLMKKYYSIYELGNITQEEF